MMVVAFQRPLEQARIFICQARRFCIERQCCVEFNAERRELFHFWRVGAKEQFELFARCAERGLDERLIRHIAKHAP